MKNISAGVLELLASNSIMHYHLVKIGPFIDTDGNTQTYRHTTVAGGITILNDGFYTDNNYLVAVDPPRQSAAVDRESFKVTYADPTFEYRALFEQGFMGIPITVYLGFFNTLEKLVGGPIDANTKLYPQGVIEGMPLESPDDIIIIYQGTTDTPTYSIDLKGEIVATLECTSPMGALGMIRSMMTNRETLRQEYPNDTSYDELFIGSSGLALLWGKV